MPTDPNSRLIKALEDHTRALADNSKALRENTKEIRARHPKRVTVGNHPYLEEGTTDGADNADGSGAGEPGTDEGEARVDTGD